MLGDMSEWVSKNFLYTMVYKSKFRLITFVLIKVLNYLIARYNLNLKLRQSNLCLSIKFKKKKLFYIVQNLLLALLNS